MLGSRSNYPSLSGGRAAPANAVMPYDDQQQLPQPGLFGMQIPHPAEEGEMSSANIRQQVTSVNLLPKELESSINTASLLPSPEENSVIFGAQNTSKVKFGKTV